jgi:hypothetical protein
MSLSKFASYAEYEASIVPGKPPETAAKPVVRYNATAYTFPLEVGSPTQVVPVDHPAAYLNGRLATTSYIVAVDGTSFETRNTRYELAET